RTSKHFDTCLEVGVVKCSFFNWIDEPTRNVGERHARRSVEACEVQPSPDGPSFEAAVEQRDPVLYTDLLFPVACSCRVCYVSLREIVVDIIFVDTPVFH